MALESFYGGKQGVSPVVKARFKYVDTNDPAYQNATAPQDSEVMELCFEDINYEDVWYGELAIIDTVNKRNKNNGKLFRRVLKRNEGSFDENYDTPCGEYIGRIVGPSEGFPRVKIGSIDDIKIAAKENYNHLGENGDYIYPSVDSDGKITYIDTINSESDFDDIDSIKATTDNGQLIPGAIRNEDGWENIQDGINYTWVNIRDNSGDEEDTCVYLGFDIPYPVFDFTVTQTNWNDEMTMELIEDDVTTPFFQKYKLTVPSGAPGSYCGDLRTAKIEDFKNWSNNSNVILYDYQTIQNYFINGTLPNYYNNLPTFGIDGSKNIDIWVYTFHLFDAINTTNGITALKQYNCYLGKVREIENITIDGVATEDNNNKPTGDMTVFYKDGTEQTFKIRILQEVEAQDGKIYFKYSDSNEKKEIFNYSFVNGITVDSDTKELKYSMEPRGAQLPNYDSTNPFNSYRSFGNGIYLNTIENTFIGKNGHLYILYSSSALRASPTQNVITNINYYPYPMDIYTDNENNKKWCRGGDLPDASDWYLNGRNTGPWWLDLGVIVQSKNVSKIAGSLNTERYDNIRQKRGEEPYPWENENIDSNDILDILNGSNDSWTYDGYDFNPYAYGNIYNYSNNTIVEGNPKAYITENLMGQLIYYKGEAFYYDHLGGDGYVGWKLAGAWNTSEDSTQLRIYKDENDILPSSLPPTDQGFDLLVPVIENNSYSSNKIDIWERD